MDGGLAEQASTGAVATTPSRRKPRTAPAESGVPETERPRLLFFYARTSGLSRRVEAYLAQVLQRHRNHSTFRVIRVPIEDQRELAAAFEIEAQQPKARLEAPRDRASIEAALSPWLR